MKTEIVASIDKRVLLKSLITGEYFIFTGGFAVFCKTDGEIEEGKPYCFDMENGKLPWFCDDDMVFRVELVSKEAIQFKLAD